MARARASLRRELATRALAPNSEHLSHHVVKVHPHAQVPVTPVVLEAIGAQLQRHERDVALVHRLRE